MYRREDDDTAGTSTTASTHSKPKLLIIDGSGTCRLSAGASTSSFKLVARRYECASMLITTNQGVAQWGTVFGHEVLTADILDRLRDHSHTLKIQGDRYRLRQKKKAGQRGSSHLQRRLAEHAPADGRGLRWALSAGAGSR